jgi:ankyrin repeat protein
MTTSSKISRWQHAVLLLVCLLSASHLPTVISQSSDDLSPADTELFEACSEEDVDAAAEALKNGANINAISPRGSQTPLMQSVLHGKIKMVKFALENGADVTIGERDGYTPMHGAGFQGHAEIAELLLKHGVGLRDVHKDRYEPARE